MIRLGWRNPRPNDFNSPDERPLKDLFGGLQRFLTFPHVGVDLGGSSGGGSFAQLDMTAKGAHNSYSLVRNNSISVPHSFQSWLFIGNASAQLNNGGTAGRRIMQWRLNGAEIDLRALQQHNNSTTQASRLEASTMVPVVRGDNLTVYAFSAGSAEGVAGGAAWGIFLPLS